MYLLPTGEELNRLWREFSPRERFLRAARQAVNYACSPNSDSMAAFFLESEDIELAMEDDCTEFDYIEDDILNMRRDINGFRIPREQQDFDDYAGVNLGEKVNWEDI